ncbi:MAG: extracellular solute-binding protein [Sphaerochaetaceae bacterium]|nr:extracellular solute-binding protein [Sphaerochaetaceae bacterium]MDC7247428.1 extracellular solute-binding protein [Sphaerochaetaceae bacterium]
MKRFKTGTSRMKKIVLFLIVLLSACTFAFAGGAGEEMAVEGEPSGELVIYTSYSNDLQNILIDSFREKYPKIDVQLVEGGAGELKARVKAEAANPQGDIVTGITYSDLNEMKPYLQPYIAKNNEAMPEDAQGEMTDGYLTYQVAQCVNLLVNKELAQELGVEIKGYADLLNPKLKGKIISANPSNSSSAWDQLVTMLVVMGGLGSEESWEYVEKFTQQLDGKISGSSSSVYKNVFNGEYVVGVTYEAPCIEYIKAGQGDKVELVYMEEGTTASFHGNGIIKDCNNLENAKLFMDHLIADETQMHMERDGTHRQANLNLPNTADFRVPMDELKLMFRDEQYLAEHRAEIVARWESIWAKYSK